jgi:hypothetical protein
MRAQSAAESRPSPRRIKPLLGHAFHFKTQLNRLANSQGDFVEGLRLRMTS